MLITGFGRAVGDGLGDALGDGVGSGDGDGVGDGETAAVGVTFATGPGLPPHDERRIAPTAACAATIIQATSDP